MYKKPELCDIKKTQGFVYLFILNVLKEYLHISQSLKEMVLYENEGTFLWAANNFNQPRIHINRDCFTVNERIQICVLR